MLVTALSVTEQVEKIGAYAGAVAFFGLALLTLLYFAQARELKRLREWAGRAPERAAESEARAVAAAALQASQPRRVPVPPVVKPPPVAPAAAAPPVAAQNGEAAAEVTTPDGGAAAKDDSAADGAAEPGAPGGEAKDAAPAPGLTSATAGATVPPGADAAASPEGTDVTPGTTDATADGDAAPSPLVVPPAGAAAGAGAVSASAPASPPAPPRPPVPSAPVPRTAAGGATRRPVPAAPLRSAGTGAPARRAVPPPPPAARRGTVDLDDREPSGRGRTALIVGGVVAGLAVLALVATTLLGGEDPQLPNRPAGTTTGGAAATPTAENQGSEPGTSRADTTVAVLNGSVVSGLAKNASEEVVKGGFKAGTIENWPEQSVQTSLIFFAPEARARAREVARLLKISGQPQAIDENVRALAGEDADVVVVVGSDQTP